MTSSLPTSRRTLLVIAGLDATGGAGFIADVRVGELLGVRPVGVVTALTEQSTEGVRASHAVDPEILAAQLDLLLSDVAVDAVKIGLIPDENSAAAIARALALTAAPVVWDPVLRPTAGVIFYRGDLARTVADLAPHVTVLTPNADEAAALTGRAVATLADAAEAARHLVAMGFPAVLLKGGHLADGSIDLLAERITGGVRIGELRGARVTLPDGGVHGTGCALATALAAHLAGGAALADACRSAKAFVAERLGNPVNPGRGRAALL